MEVHGGTVDVSGLALGALVVGTVVAADPSGWAPFGPAKWLVVSTLGALGVGLALWRRGSAAHRWSWWAWAALVALLTLAALVNDDVPTALLGHPDRHLGVLTWLLLWALFVAGQRLDAASATTVVSATVVAALVLGGWSVVELVAGQVIDLATDTRRLTGPFGSAAMLGAAACLFAPVGAGVAFDRGRRRAWRAVAAVAAWGSLVALVGSGSRGAWLAAGAAIGVAVVLVRPRRWLLGAAAVVLAVACVAPRLGDVAERSQGAASRLDEWRVATSVIADHAVVGVGPEGYRIAVAQGIDDGYERAHRRDAVLPDRAHSAPLDVALDGGILAGALHLALLGFVGWRAVRLLRSRPSPSDAGLAVGALAYGLQQLVLFPLAELDPVFWLLSGVVVARAAAPRPVAAPARVVATCALVLVPIALVAGALDVAADRLAADALRTGSTDDARRAVELRPDNVRYRLAAAVVLDRRGTIADLDRALDELDAAAHWSPRDPVVADQRASVLLDRAVSTGTDADIAAALDAWRGLVATDPHRARWQLQLGRAAALAGDTATARQAWQRAADLGEPGAADLLGNLPA